RQPRRRRVDPHHQHGPAIRAEALVRRGGRQEPADDLRLPGSLLRDAVRGVDQGERAAGALRVRGRARRSDHVRAARARPEPGAPVRSGAGGGAHRRCDKVAMRSPTALLLVALVLAFGYAKPAARAADDTPKTETAILAGGCFWGMEEILRTIPGVISTQAGYTGGPTPNPPHGDGHT